jgi:hypothetical protein
MLSIWHYKRVPQKLKGKFYGDQTRYVVWSWMLAYKKMVCPTTECRRNAYVALDLWSHKNRLSLERWYTWSSRGSTNWRKACLTSVEVVWPCLKETLRGTSALWSPNSRDINMRRGRGRPKLTLEEAIKKIWKVRIYLEIFVWIGVLGKQLLTCLNRDKGLMLGSTLAYPNVLVGYLKLSVIM